jgi:DNA excision repair protein ERCC-1
MTLRSNFGVWIVRHGKLVAESILQSFSDIVHATPEQLLACPGFGNLKVRRFKDTVDKPFRPAAAARAITGSISAPVQDPEASTSSKIAATRQQRPEREKSPDWPDFDIELDLN